MKFPSSFMGCDGKKELERIMNCKPVMNCIERKQHIKS